MNNDIAKRITAIILSCLASFLTVILIFWYKQNPQLFIEQKLGITKHVFNNIYLWVATFIITIGYIVYTTRVIPFVREHLYTISMLKIIGIWAALTISPMEEIVFRQLLMDYLHELNFFAMGQIVISAIVFGLAHSLWFFLNWDRSMVLPVILSTTVLGFALAIIYIIGDRNILAPIVAHIIINLAIEPWLILAAISNTWKND